MKTMLVTGGAGFIGTNFIRHILTQYPDYRVINLDKLTYAGNLSNLQDLAENPRYDFITGDICDSNLVDALFSQGHIHFVVNFAAESHVDRSIMGAGEFLKTNAEGVYTLLQAARKHNIDRFLQVSTDEVYGSLGPTEKPWTERSPLQPRNPYSVTKASGDMMAQAFFHTYSMPIVITRASNNIGPYQYPEKRVPLFITHAIDDLPLPIYGTGLAVRDHLFVTDHCEAIDLVLHQGTPGQIYNVGAENEANGLDVTHAILQHLGKPPDLIAHIADRPGHDQRYALNTEKVQALGWVPKHTFTQALEKTINWYVENDSWWRQLKNSQGFKSYYQKQYAPK